MRRRSFLFGAAGAARYGARAGRAAPEGLGTIAYVRHDGLWRRALPDGRPTRLVSGARIAAPRFSPSGQWIACLRDDLLHVVSIDGGRSADLGKPDPGSPGPGAQWAPVRDDLWMAGPGGLSVFTAESGWRGAVRGISGAGLPVVFHPDGKEMVYGDVLVNGRGPGGEPLRIGRLCRLALAPNSRPTVLSSTPLSDKIPCVWTRHGESVVFWEDSDFSASIMADGLELFRIPAAGGAPRSLGLSTLVRPDMLSCSPAPERLAVSTGGGRSEWQEKRIAVLDPETAALSYLTENGMAAVCPAWSPGGDAIAYSAAPGPRAGSSVGGGEPARRLLAKRRIWVVEVNGTPAPRPLTADSRYRDEEPRWSASGNHLLFCRMAADNSKTLWLIGADGSDAAQVAGPLYLDAGPAGEDSSWFGYYGYVEWRAMFDWFRGQ
jgi:Tol biopolymer transport system component